MEVNHPSDQSAGSAPIPEECEHLWQVHNGLVALCEGVPDEQKDRCFTRTIASNATYTETLALLLNKRLRDENKRSWSRREWSGWLKDLQKAENGYEQTVSDMAKKVDVSTLHGMFQKHDEIFE